MEHLSPKTTTIRLPVETRQRLDKLAEREDRKVHWLMVKAIEEMLARKDAEEKWFRERVAAAEKDRSEGKLIDALEACDLMDKYIAELRTNG